MANEEYKQLKNKVTSLGQEVSNLEEAIQTYKGWAEDPEQSESERAKYLAKYKQAVSDLKARKKEYESAKKDADKIVSDIALESVQAKYAKLKERLDLQLNPDSASAKKIQKEIDALVPETQRALKLASGVNVSPTVAKTKLTGGQVPTLAENEGTGVQAVGTEVPGEKPTIAKTADTKAAGAATGTGGKAKLPKKTKEEVLPTVEEKETAASKILSAADFGLSEALFKNIPSLKAIFEKYTNPKSGMTDDEFRKLIRNDNWYKQNSKEIKARFVQYYNYQDLKNSGQATGSTDYEQEIEKIKRSLSKSAAIMGSDIASNPDELTKIAENLYITDRSDDESFITDLLSARIRPVAGTIGGKGTTGYSGQALQNYNSLVRAARENGFQVSDIIPGGTNVDQVLQNIAAGKIDVNRVINDARTLASQGQPQYVRDLLAQGYNLNQIYQPYRQTMANILEIGDADQIDLNDPVLRSAITDKGDMNLYDFKKALRQDKRWQYTEQAKEDVSNAALTVLRDFGFQG